jgi:hypothetical protein
MSESKMLRNKELIKLLQNFDPDLPVIIHKVGKGDDYGLTEEDVQIVGGAYFGNFDTNEKFPKNQNFIQIGMI